VRVLDLSQVYNGPYATFLMANAGAEVIKVEPPGGEFLRRRNARAGSLLPFFMLNSNKSSISLNLKSPRGPSLFKALARDADVVVENFAPGVMTRLGVDYDTLREVNPALVYASGSGYGQHGRYRDMPAMDLTVQAMSGLVSSTGFPDNPPVKAGAAICDFLGGVHLYGAVTTALFHRERTGEGSRIDVAMLDTVFPSMVSNIGGLFGDRDDVPPRTGNQHGGLSLCPYNVYRASDGYIAILCNHDRHWASLCTTMDRPDLAAEARYATVKDRVARMQEVDEHVEGWSSTRSRDDLFQRLVANRVPCAPVRELRETLADEHLHERGMLLEVEHPIMGTVTVCRSPLRFEGRPPPAYVAPPEYGQDNERIYGGVLGLDAEALDALRRDGVV
jgi:formyl-CoA transferase